MIHLLFFLPILCLIAGLAYLVRKWPDGGMQVTFSHHAASTAQATRYYVILFLTCLPPIVVWYVVWLAPHLGLPVVASATMVIAAAAQIVAAYVPEREPRIAVHRGITAMSVAAILMTLLLIWLTTRNGFVLAISLVMLLIVGYAGVLRDRARYPLVLQAGFYTLFFMVLGSFVVMR